MTLGIIEIYLKKKGSIKDGTVRRYRTSRNKEFENLKKVIITKLDSSMENLDYL